MGDIISSVQNTAVKIVNSLDGTDAEPTSYVLMGYNDPVGTNIITSTDATAFNAHLESLFAFAGADCPEPAMAAVNLTLDKVDDESNIFLLTDAEPSDSGDVAGTILKARRKNAHVNIFQFPSACGGSLTYRALALGTSGSYHGLSDRTATSDLVKIAIDLIKPTLVPLYSDFPIIPTLTSTSIPPRAQNTIELLVDSTLDTITITSAGSASLTVIRPDGTIVSSRDGKVNYVTGPDFTYVTITKPVVGKWKATRSGDATSGTSLSVTGSSFLTFNNFQFVEIRGKHPGWFPLVDTTLNPGNTYEVTANVEGAYSTASFEFHAQDTGDVLTTFDLTRDEGIDGLPPSQIWHGNVTLPCGSFYAYVLGTDTTGAPFQRFYPTVFGTPGNCPQPSPTATPSTGPTTASSSLTIGKWNTTTTSIASYTCTSSNCQGVSMTETVVIISTLTTCPYYTTVSPCPTESTGPCLVSTSSISMVPHKTTTVMVPVATTPVDKVISTPGVIPSNANISSTIASSTIKPVTAGAARSFSLSSSVTVLIALSLGFAIFF